MGGMDIIGQKMHCVLAVLFTLPSGQLKAAPVVAPLPKVLTVPPPIFDPLTEFPRLASPTSFGSSLSMSILLQLTDGSTVHTGQFLVYERIALRHITARIVDP